MLVGVSESWRWVGQDFAVTLEEHENHAARVDSLENVTDAHLQDLCLFE